jgi:hypothetical protein
MSYNLKLETHYYDNYIKNYFNEIKNKLPTIQDKEELKYYWEQEIIPLGKSTNIEILSRVPSYVYNKWDIDGNIGEKGIGYSCNLLGAQVWKVIRNNPDAMSLFMRQFIDMELTSGFCSAGQNNRYIQVYLAFSEN